MKGVALDCPITEESLLRTSRCFFFSSSQNEVKDFGFLCACGELKVFMPGPLSKSDIEKFSAWELDKEKT